MELSGLEVYKLLPRTDCKECGFPSCLAFAMKVSAKHIEVTRCPYVSEESFAASTASAGTSRNMNTNYERYSDVPAGKPDINESEYRHADFVLLRDKLMNRVSLDDIRSLCFELDIDFEAIPGESKPTKLNELLIYVENRRKYDVLVDAIRKLRPDIS